CVMLHEFLTNNRDDLIARCRTKVGGRRTPLANDAALLYGIPRFLDQLIKTLEMEQTADPMRSRAISGPADGIVSSSEIGLTAAQHGLELLHQGFTVDQVVHDYGDLCQSITDLALDRQKAIMVDEFRTLNRCLDNGIADAVKEFAFQRENLLAEGGIQASNERLGYFAHELRNLLNTAMLAVAALKTGSVGLSGATGGVLDRSLTGLRMLIDRSLADVRVTADMPARHHLISVADFIADVKISASLDARVRQCQLTVAPVDLTLAVSVDREMLFAAVSNLLQNALKFTCAHTEVSLTAYAARDRLLIDVEDHCGGLAPGVMEKMFTPFEQGGEDRSGLGLGLLICRRAVQANRGILRVRNLPGSGCVFTIDLPRHALPK
ncbi:MAG: HAMP domain-containing sensor histidine kinase, partial [Betaproteobacteria bacterium]